jgi:hypothetical protein
MQRIHLLSKNLIPHRVGLCTIFLLVQWGCAIPLVERKAKFIESEYAPYAGEGTATLCGQAVVQTRRGEFKYGAGNEAYLNPVTSYSTEWYRVSVIGGRSLTKADPKALAYNRATRADGNGRFCFENIPSGDYYLACPVVWAYGANSAKIVAMAYAQVTVKEGETVNAVLTRRTPRSRESRWELR